MTTRAHCMVVCYDPTTNTVLTGASVSVYTPGTVTLVPVALYDKNGNVLSNPLTSDATTGLIDFYLAVSQEVDLTVSKGGFTTRTYSNVPVLDDASLSLSGLLTTTGDLAYASAANTPARLGIGGLGTVLTASGAGTVPTWTSSPVLGGSGLNTAPTLSLRNTKSDGTFGFVEARRVDSDANQIGYRWANAAYNNGWDLFLASGNAGTVLTLQNIGGGGTFLFDSTPSLTIGASAASTGSLRLSNTAKIAWRNAANSADIQIGFNSSNQFEIDPDSSALVTTVGAAGGASALPASPVKYMIIQSLGAFYKIPLYNT